MTAGTGAVKLGTARDGSVLVDVRGLSKRFLRRRSWREIMLRRAVREYRTVLDSITFDVRRGEFFGLLGQNGAGKTTLFRILSTLVLPDEGSATVAGLDTVRDSRGVRALVAPVIANERSLYWRLNTRENLRLFAVLQRIPESDVAREIDRVLEIVRLTDTGDELVGTFSSGMRQRLLIARALLGKPSILLLDEPTRSLDPISARDFRRFLSDVVVKEQDCTVLLATHDADDVWNLCSRVAVLHRGRMLAIEETSQLRSRAGDDVFRIWVREGEAERAALIMGDLMSVRESAVSIEPGWREILVEIPGEMERGAELLSRLVASGVSVGRFEQTAPDLADLIEKVIARSEMAGQPIVEVTA